MELKFQVTHHICSNFLPFVFMHSLSQVCTTQKMFLKLVWDFILFFSNDAMILCWISMHKHRNCTYVQCTRRQHFSHASLKSTWKQLKANIKVIIFQLLKDLKVGLKVYHCEHPTFVWHLIFCMDHKVLHVENDCNYPDDWKSQAG